MLTRSPVFVLLLAIAAVPAVAPAQHHVGNGNLPTIQAAIDAAAPGDVIEVAAGVYPAFHVDKPLTIAAEPSALVQIVTTGVIGLDLQPGHRVHLGGLDIEAGAMTVNGGIVSAERCTLHTDVGLQLTDCVMTMRWSSAGAQNGSGVLVQDAHLHASDSSFSTAAGGGDHIEHGGVKIQGASACHLALCSLLGAWPVTPAKPWPSTGLLAPTATAANARIWLVDCNFIGGYQTSGMQGPALAVPSIAMSNARAHRCQASGLVIGNLAAGCVLGVHTPTDLQIGSSFTARMLGEPGHPLLLYVGTETLGLVPLPLVEQPALQFADMVVLGTFIANAQGAADFAITVPNNPTLRHLQVWWRGLDLFQMPWQATPAFVTLVQ